MCLPSFVDDVPTYRVKGSSCFCCLPFVTFFLVMVVACFPSFCRCSSNIEATRVWYSSYFANILPNGVRKVMEMVSQALCECFERLSVCKLTSGQLWRQWFNVADLLFEKSSKILHIKKWQRNHILFAWVGRVCFSGGCRTEPKKLFPWKIRSMILKKYS